MYVPEPYRPRTPSWAADLIRANPLALLVTSGADGPYATHLPAILDEDSLPEAEDDGQPLVGAHLYGHLNRMNPHWGALQASLEDGDALVVFQGPHGYVSPTVYEIQPAAPTWNFTAVHVRGTLRLLDTPAETLWVVTRTVQTFERRLGTGWDMTGSLGYFDRLLPGVGAFRLDIAAVDCMIKLSQEQPAEVRERVTRDFARSDRGTHRELADLMTSLAEGRA